MLCTLTLAALVAASCAVSDGRTGSERVLTISAAASLTEPFTELKERFEAAHEDVTVRLNFAGSAQLAQQIVRGAPVDVFAAASSATMRTVTDAGVNSGDPMSFARNVLLIAVPAGNPARITGLADFGRAELTVAVCQEQVPCGAAAMAVFQAADVVPRPDTVESDVRAVLTKVELGEVDAGLVYRTDVRAVDGAVQGIEFPESDQAVNEYRVVTVSDSPVAAAFVDLVRSRVGQDVLTDAGFLRGEGR